jgi:hypothetical protein
VHWIINVLRVAAVQLQIEANMQDGRAIVQESGSNGELEKFEQQHVVANELARCSMSVNGVRMQV